MLVELDLDEEGRPLVVKRAVDPSEAAALRTEIAITRQGLGRHVLSPLDFDDGDEPRVTWPWMPGGSLAEPAEGRLDTVVVAQVVADAADAVATLHGAGLAHTRLDAHHVLIDGGRHGVLIGLSQTKPLSAATQADDLGALTALLTDVARASHAPPDVRAQLLAVVETDIRNPAALAEAIRAVVTPRTLPPPTTAEAANAARVVLPRAPARRSIAMPWRGVASAAAVIAVVAGIAVGAQRVISVGASSVAAVPTAEPAAPVRTEQVSESTVARATQVWPTTTTISPREIVAAGTPVPDGRVTIAGRTYRLSVAPTDVVVVADWDCDGAPTPAILRIPSGAVDLFDRLSTSPTEQVAARRVATVSAAESISAVSVRGASCVELAVTTADGTTEIVSVTP